MRVWDVRRAIQALRRLGDAQQLSLRIHAVGSLAIISAYAAMFEDGVGELVLSNLPLSHREGPFFFNIDRYVGMSAAMALTGERTMITTDADNHPAIQYMRQVGRQLGWKTVRPDTTVAVDSSVQERSTHNVILVTMDGLRWQELFAGADGRLMNRDAGGVREEQALKNRFWDDKATTRRDKLMPFFWHTVARNGQVFGDPGHGSSVRCSNQRYFSYPGYSELLCGFADPTIDSNDKIPNKNITVLEWLNRHPGFRGRVGAVASWDVFPFILNEPRSQIYVNAGWEDTQPWTSHFSSWRAAFPFETELPRTWAAVRYDIFTFHRALEYLRQHRPRVLFVGLGETDDWAHEGRYDLYLDAAWKNDRYIEALWQAAQALPDYRDRTTLVITTDHGRGDGRDGWKSHGVDYAGSDSMWVAILGPDTPAMGVRENQHATQAQIAASVAHLLGLDFQASDPRIQPPLPNIVTADLPTTTKETP
jgi:hypothetical protein